MTSSEFGRLDKMTEKCSAKRCTRPRAKGCKRCFQCLLSNARSSQKWRKRKLLTKYCATS